MLTELISLIVSWAGVFIGLGLSKIAKEEVEYGKRNLAVLHNILLITILISFFYLTKYSLLNKTLILLIVFIIAVMTESSYAILGIIFGLNPDFMTSVLIFIFGFPMGSLLYKENYKKIARKTAVYLILGLIALLVRTYLLI